MKRITYAALAALLLPLASCSDEFMDTESKTSFNNETAYGNADLCQMALMGCYDGWQRVIGEESEGMYLGPTLSGDECVGGAGIGETNVQVHVYFDSSLNAAAANEYDGDWKNYYNGIYNCNVLIQQGAGKCGDKEGLIMGQARALRAIFYYDLARMFGRVPLLTEPTEENLPQASIDEVYDLIFEDLKYAIANIPADYANGSNIDQTNGLIGKYGAEALLARAYLFYSGRYGKDSENCSRADAVEAINDIVTNGGYDLERNYADLWFPACTEEVKEGEDYMWKSSYAGKWYDGKAWQAGQGHLSKEFVLSQAFNTTQDYDGHIDGLVFCRYLGPRKIYYPPLSDGWGICPPSGKFISDVLPSTDPRAAASYYDCKEIGLEAAEKFPNVLADSYEYTGYYIKKFQPLCFSNETYEAKQFNLGIAHENVSFYRDFPVVRYADVLLMQSELTGDVTGINKVQDRAGVNRTGASKDEIFTERAKEFAFEGLRYWDLLRYDTTLDYAVAQLSKHIDGVAVKNGGVEAVTSFDADKFRKTEGLFWLPLAQLQLSGGTLVQNPGWPDYNLK